jgi:hypothetical protein
MATGVPDYVQAAATLRHSLEDAADALGNADLARLLDCESRIHAALTHLACSRLRADARAPLAQEIVMARAALARCRRLGASLNDFARIVLSAQGLDDGYGRRRADGGADLRTIHRTA